MYTCGDGHLPAQHAEFYAMQMYRLGCRSKVEADTGLL